MDPRYNYLPTETIKAMMNREGVSGYAIAKQLNVTDHAVYAKLSNKMMTEQSFKRFESAIKAVKDKQQQKKKRIIEEAKDSVDPEKIKENLRINRIPYWKIAFIIGIGENTLGRWLRHPVNKETACRIDEAIKQINNERKEANA